MYLLRIELTGSFSITVDFSAFPPSMSPFYVVTGPNGSGKSLLVTGLLAVLGKDDVCAGLADAGIEQIKLTALSDNHVALIVCDVSAGSRTIRWEAAPPELSKLFQTSTSRPPHRTRSHEAPSTSLVVPELFGLVNIVQSGRLNMPTAAALRDAVLNVIKAPMEHELAGWIARQTELAVSQGEGGRIAAARFELEQAERELARVETTWRQLELLRQRQHDLASRMAETKANGEVLIAEIEELTKLTGIAERAARLEAWIEEIRHENRDLQHLREKHAELQTRLDELDNRFRGAPEKLAGILDRYTAARDREAVAAAHWAERHSQRALKQAELESLKRELADGTPLDDATGVQRQNELRLEIEKTNRELTELLRGRIELVRQREGVKQQLSREYAQLAGLDETERHRLETVLRRGEAKLPPVEEVPQFNSEARERERRIASLQATIKERFPGFERLRTTVPELLREYHDVRRVLSTLSGDLDGLRARIARLKRKSHAGKNAIWGLAAGLVCFAAAALIWSWDIGLFAALSASGVTWLAFYYLNRGVEMELESATAAEVMISRRVEETRAARTKLEQNLEPLTSSATLDAALKRYQEYRRLCDQLAELESSPLESAPSPALRIATESEDLPEALAGTPLPVLQRLYTAFCEAESRQTELDEIWRQFEPGGVQAERIRATEERLQQLQAEHAALLTESQTRQNRYASRRSEVIARVAEIETESNRDDDVVRLETEWSGIREEMAALELASGGIVRNADVESVRSEWNEREALRTRLREIRNQLSAQQTQDELRARETLLTEEMAEMRQKLGALDPLYMLDGTAVDYAAKYAGQLRAAHGKIRENDEQLQNLQRELDAVNTDDLLAALGNERPLDELQAVVIGHRERLETLERDLMTTRELIALITDEIAEKKATLSGDLSAAIDLRVRTLTDGRCLSLEERDGVWFVDMAEGATKKLETLSDGTRDVIALAVRLAVLDMTADADRNPVVWDEALWRLDDHNLLRVRDEIEKLAHARQVILLTRFPAMESWGIAVRLGPELQSSGVRVFS